MTPFLITYALLSLFSCTLWICLCIVSKRAEADAERARGL